MRDYEKYTETKTVTYNRRDLISITCDKCNGNIPENQDYESRESELIFANGTVWPDGSGNKNGWEVQDLCDPCIEWVKALLIENGVKVSDIDMAW